MPAAEGKTSLNLSIDERVATAAKRVFAGKKRSKGLSAKVERFLIRLCKEAGEQLPAELFQK